MLAAAFAHSGSLRSLENSFTFEDFLQNTPEKLLRSDHHLHHHHHHVTLLLCTSILSIHTTAPRSPTWCTLLFLIRGVVPSTDAFGKLPLKHDISPTKVFSFFHKVTPLFLEIIFHLGKKLLTCIFWSVGRYPHKTGPTF